MELKKSYMIQRLVVNTEDTSNIHFGIISWVPTLEVTVLFVMKLPILACAGKPAA